MNIEITKTKAPKPLLTLKKNKSTETEAIQGNIDNKVLQNENTVLVPPVEALDFNTIYNELHSKFPNIINLNKPVLLAVGIRKEMSNVTGISGVILKRWIGKYVQKSKYYNLHQEGAVRYNLNGEEAGNVTEKHCDKMAKSLEKKKITQEKLKEDDKVNKLNNINQSE